MVYRLTIERFIMENDIEQLLNEIEEKLFNQLLDDIFGPETNNDICPCNVDPNSGEILFE